MKNQAPFDVASILSSKLVLPTRIMAGTGCADKLLPECAAFGARGMLVHGRSLKTGATLERLLQSAPRGLSVSAWQHAGGEPTLTDLERLLEDARQNRAEWVAGVGGGSVLDLAKACAALFRAPQAPRLYHEGAPIEPNSAIPFAAVPTTAGTGSEVTVNSVLTNLETRRKTSIRHDSMMARLVILDAALLKHCPPSVAAHAGMDALTQALEAYISRHAVWLSDMLALQALTLLNQSLESFFINPSDQNAADSVLTGSCLAGLAFSIARLGVVHGIAHPLGVNYHLPHGLVCGVCLPWALELNRATIGAKYAQIGETLGKDPITRIRTLLNRLQIASPFAGRPLIAREAMINATLTAWSTKANPKTITAADIEWLLARLFEEQKT